jgi:ribosomal protein S18 acetylase RimI-like enzyme
MKKDEVKIRSLNTSDISEVENFCRCNWATFVEVDDVENMSDKEFADIAKKSQDSMIKPNSDLINIVAILKGDLIGSHFLTRKKDDAGKEIFHINNLYVKKEWRGYGIARRMKEFAEKLAKDIGVVAITTSVDTHNKKIIHLNEVLGYKTVKYILRKDLT